MAILVGDYLLVLASRQAAMVNPAVATTVANAITGMIEGQSLETSDLYNTRRTVANYTEASRQKTAALLAAACTCGGLAAGLGDETVTSLERYGEAFGLAFQVVDDLLDVLSTPPAMGKPVGNDIVQGVYTLPVLLALQGRSAAQVRPWLGRDGLFPTQSEVATTLLGSGAIGATIKAIRAYNAAAGQALEGLQKTAVVKGLAQLPDYYLEWALQKVDPKLHISQSDMIRTSP